MTDCTCSVGCVDGDVYDYCEAVECDGFCEYIGRCPCPAAVHQPGRHDRWSDD